MYATRLLSTCRNNLSILAETPVETSSSGYLVITDEETEAEDACCWGTCDNNSIEKLPLPQNKILYTDDRHEEVWFIPIVDQPLSSNRYYVIHADGKHKGQAITCSKEEDKVPSWFGRQVEDAKPRSFDYNDIYQQVEIIKSQGFYAKSVAQDGYPPFPLRHKYWSGANIARSIHCNLSGARGLNSSLRKKLPEFNFHISNRSSASVVVGRWYCPFVFMREVQKLKDQMKTSIFYEMTLEQLWEEIYSCQNDGREENVVVNVEVQKEVNSLFGMDAITYERNGLDGIVWNETVDHNGGALSLGLSAVIVQKMRSIQEMGGWVVGQENDIRLEKTEIFTGEGRWQRFSCFMLVERFVLRRMDGTLLLTCDFKHTHKIQCKWE
ncbi:hypothetical protein ACHQM5_012863 [Ranunculus cassubicifolius]